MERPFHTDLVLSHPLDGIAVHRRFMDGMGNARVDGLDACLLSTKIKALSIIDRSCTGRACADATGACLSKDQRWLDCVTYCGMGGHIVVASIHVRCKTIRLVPDRHSAAHYDRC